MQPVRWNLRYAGHVTSVNHLQEKSSRKHPNSSPSIRRSELYRTFEKMSGLENDEYGAKVIDGLHVFSSHDLQFTCYKDKKYIKKDDSRKFVEGSIDFNRMAYGRNAYSFVDDSTVRVVASEKPTDEQPSNFGLAPFVGIGMHNPLKLMVALTLRT
uniref:Uncharacterized protein n=1 Tax=Vespula pensylvanica TaxID=30213 RepID=A0A834UAE3_VESPE|nr:hypothetical protein H0235_008058 [Vespula pensylvanica]